MLSVLACKNYLKVGVVLVSIKLKTICQSFLNPKMEIPTTHEILLFRLVLCTIVLVFGATYDISFSINSFFCVSNICSDYFRTSCVWNRKIVFFGRLYSWLFFCLQQNSSSLSLYVFPYSNALVLNHHFSLQFSWMLNFCSIGTLLASLNSSIVFPLFCLYHIPPIFIESERICFGASTSVSPTFSTTFTRWERYARKDVSGI